MGEAVEGRGWGRREKLLYARLPLLYEHDGGDRCTASGEGGGGREKVVHWYRLGC